VLCLSAARHRSGRHGTKELALAKAKLSEPSSDRTNPRHRKVRARDVPNQLMLEHWLSAAPDDRMAHLIRDAARGLSRSLQLRLAQHELSFGHWQFLRALWEGDGLSQTDLSAAVGVTEPTTVAALKTMEMLGLIERRKRPGNRKKIHVYLTPAGRALKAKLVPLAVEVNEIALRGVKAADVAAMRRVLLAMVINLAEDEAAAVGLQMRIPSTREVARARAASGHRR
jgi:DNA-binding MarR family transcriptional regulator